MTSRSALPIGAGDTVVGVVGASGRLGQLVVAALHEAGTTTVAVDLRGSDAASRAGVLGALDALVFTASLPDAGLHREAIERGCHVIDVTIGRSLNAELLALDGMARRERRSVVAMAGCAPGLTGALAAGMLDLFSVPGGRVVVSLLQSPTGTAGRDGTRDMLDLLTGTGTYRPRPVLTSNGVVVPVRLFDLCNGEPGVTGLDARFEAVTGFGRAVTHAQVRTLRVVRSRVPVVYAPARDIVARGKARRRGTRETIQLSAVVLDGSAVPVGGRLVMLSSDYAATAAIAASTAVVAAGGGLDHGAGHLAQFLCADELVELPLVAATITSDTGPVPIADQ